MLSEFNFQETDYLIWILKTIRLPENLWLAIISHLETKVIINTKSCINDKKNISAKDLEKIQSQPYFKLDFSKFLKFREEPNSKYQCETCKTNCDGKAKKGVLNEIILCENCLATLDIENINLRFYFGWYKGWNICDFNTIEDIEYLKWILENLELLPLNYNEGIREKIKNYNDINKKM